MARIVKPLSPTQVENARPRATPYKLRDGEGLYLLVKPDGARLWRLDYTRPDGRRNTLSLASFPAVTLKQARAKRLALKTMLADGVDPCEQRRADKAAAVERSANTFQAVAEEMMSRRGTKLSDISRERALRLLTYLAPIAALPIDALDAPQLLQALRKIEPRGAETVHRARAFAGQVFRYGISTGRCRGNPAADLIGALPPMQGGHFAAITEPAELGPLLRAMHGYQGGPVVQAALKLAPLVFVRPGELRTARWADIDLDAGEWRYTTPKTKTPHIVPLAKQALAILRELQPVTGRRMYVFQGERSGDRPMSENTVSAALRALGFDGKTVTGHGFRATARTLLDEVLGFRVDHIESQLAHAVKDPTGRSYNRTTFLPQRKVMMQRWADYLDELRTGATAQPATP